MSDVIVEIRGDDAPVAHVILNRVAKRNALSGGLAAEIRQAALDLAGRLLARDLFRAAKAMGQSDSPLQFLNFRFPTHSLLLV